jgi:hypothetical protein
MLESDPSAEQIELPMMLDCLSVIQYVSRS